MKAKSAASSLTSDAPGAARGRQPVVKKSRRTQEERSHATRKLILDATVRCLVEEGYASAMTIRVVELAGVSRGALLHHFPTRATLLTEAIHHLSVERLIELDQLASSPPKGGWTVGSVLDCLWSTFSGPLFQAAIELWVAARTSNELRASLLPVERSFGRRLIGVVRHFFEDDILSHPDFEMTWQVMLNTMRGLAAVQNYEPDSESLERHWQKVRAMLIKMFDATINQASASQVANS